MFTIEQANATFNGMDIRVFPNKKNPNGMPTVIVTLADGQHFMNRTKVVKEDAQGNQTEEWRWTVGDMLRDQQGAKTPAQPAPQQA